MSELRFSLLGPVRAQRGTRSVALGPPQQQAVLAMLLVRRDRMVTAEALVDALWSDDPPSHAVGMVRTYVYRLRKAMRPDQPAVSIESTAGGGYLLRCPAEAIDLNRFEGLLAAAQTSQPAHAAQLVREALALWEGEPLAGVPGPFAEAQRHRLAERRLAAVEERIGYDLAAGRHSTVVSELPPLIAEHPLRENLVAAQMTALYRSGRTGEAIQTYQRTRQVLADELGTDPGHELTELYGRILHSDPGLAASPSLPVPAQLPADLPDFTGRDTVVSRLVEALTATASTPVIVAVCGVGGVGKTALSVHVGHSVRAAFPDGQLYVDLHGVGGEPTDPADVLARFLRALGIPPDAVPDLPGERSALLRSTLADRRVLLLLDNARDAAQVEPLLPATAGCAALVTSRARLPHLHAARGVDLDGFADTDSVALLSAVLGEERVAAEPDAAAELIALCAGLPLALRIAAARLAARPAWTIAALVERLRDERERVAELRHGSHAVASTIQLGYRQLSADAARALRLLSVPAVPHLSRHAAAAVLGASPRAAEARAESLVDLSLLTSPAPGRYGFHDLVRAVTRTLAAPGEQLEAPRRLLDHCLASARRYARLTAPHSRLPSVVAATEADGEPLADPDTARRWLADEHAGLTGLVAQALTAADPPLDHAADLLLCLWDSVEMELHPAEMERAARLIADTAAAHGATRAEGRARTLLGELYLNQSRPQAARREIDVARARCAASDDALIGALAAKYAGTAALALGEPELAAECYREALDGYRRVGDEDGVTTALLASAAALGDLHRYAEARTAGEAARARFRAAGDRAGEANALVVLGRVAIRGGDPAAAIRYLLAGEVALRDDESLMWQGRLRFRLAEAYLAAGRPAEARDAARLAADLFERIDDAVTGREALRLLAQAHADLGQPQLAERYKAEADRVVDPLLIGLEDTLPATTVMEGSSG